MVPQPPAGELADLHAEVLDRLDVDNYIDYLICHAYAGAVDWPHNNFRLGRDREGGKFQYFVWDAEWAFEPTYADFSGAERLDNSMGVTRPHFYLQSYAGYRAAFSDRIKIHLVNPGGALAMDGTEDEAITLYQSQMNKFLPLLYGESARWGDLAKAVPYTRSDPNHLPNENYMGDWDRTTDYVIDTWLPVRRAFFLDDMEGAGLYEPEP
jgi:hypothetical protein